MDDISKPPIEIKETVETETQNTLYIQNENKNVSEEKGEKKILKSHKDLSGQKKSKQRSKTEKKPANKIRYDQIGHLPEFDEKKNPTRCKNDDCRHTTHAFCSKCRVHLCLLQSRNCFRDFHVLDIGGATDNGAATKT